MRAEVEGVLVVVTVEGGAVDQAYDDAGRELTQEKVVLHHAQVVLGDRKCFKNDSLQRIFRRSFLQGSGVS